MSAAERAAQRWSASHETTSSRTASCSVPAKRFLGAGLIIIVDWRRRNYTALEGRSVLNIRFYYYEERLAVRSRRAPRVGDAVGRWSVVAGRRWLVGRVR